MTLGAMTPDEASALLQDLRGGLEADGYDLKVSGAQGKLHLSIVVAREDACEDCLVPKPIMAQIAVMALQQKSDAVTADDLILLYPAEH